MRSANELMIVNDCRFIDDEEEVAETLMNIDFDFGLYLKLTLADTFAELIQIHVIDWFVMWAVFAIVFCLYAIEPNLTTVTFFVCEMVLFLASIWLQVPTHAPLVPVSLATLPHQPPHPPPPRPAVVLPCCAFIFHIQLSLSGAAHVCCFLCTILTHVCSPVRSGAPGMGEVSAFAGHA